MVWNNEYVLFKRERGREGGSNVCICKMDKNYFKNKTDIFDISIGWFGFLKLESIRSIFMEHSELELFIMESHHNRIYHNTK